MFLSLTAADLTVRPCAGAPDFRRAAVAAFVSLTAADLTVHPCAGAPDFRRAAVAALG